MLGSEIHAIRTEHEFAMPAPGISIGRAQAGGKKYERITYRCPAENCYYVCCPSSEKVLNEVMIPMHARNDGCPSWPRRESLPSGLSYAHRIWNEIDCVMDVIVAEKTCDDANYLGMFGDKLQGYARGLAMVLSMLEGEVFPDVKSVAREAGIRRKIRTNQIPWRATPSKYDDQFKTFGTGSGWRVVEDNSEEQTPPVRPGKRASSPSPMPFPATGSGARPNPQLQAGMRHVRNFGGKSAEPDAGVKANVRSAHASGGFSHEMLAGLYGLTIDQIKEICG